MGKAKDAVFVGVDDGHYAIKIVTEDGQFFSIPSRAKAGKHLISIGAGGAGGEGFYTTEEGNSFTVSEHLSDTEKTTVDTYPKSELNRVLVHHALRSAGLGGVDVSIATGLPVHYYYRPDGEINTPLINAKMANLKKKVSGAHGEQARIVRNDVTTEAIAAYIDQLMDMDGNATPFFEESRHVSVGVIDIGGKTTDCAVVLPGGSQVDNQRSGSIELGILQLSQTVHARLMAEYGFNNLPPTVVESAIHKGVIRVAGNEVDVSKIVDREKDELANRILDRVHGIMGNGYDLECVLVVGGGSIVLRELIAAKFKHARFPDRPEFANARGMLKTAKYIHGGD